MSRIFFLGALITASVVFAGCNATQPQTQAPTSDVTATETVPVVEENQVMEAEEFSLAEVAQHATATDCWMAIEGKVYDVTSYISQQRHPGGAAILEGCGKDATELFNTRPMGSGTAHSNSARAGLENFYIGELATE